MKKFLLSALSLLPLVACNQGGNIDAINIDSNANQTKIQSNTGLNNYWQEIVKADFNGQDTNRDGSVTLDEFRIHWNYDGETPKDVFNRIDKNKDGELSLSEAKAFNWFGQDKNISRAFLLQTFKDAFKCDEKFTCTGSLSKNNFMNSLHFKTDTDPKFVDLYNFAFYAGDKNKDNKLNFSELEDIGYAMAMSGYNKFVPTETPQPVVVNPVETP